MSETHYIYLIPGFFGFADLGGITYFHHVRGVIEANYAKAGLTCEIHEVKTRPTASIRLRAGRLFETIADTAKEDGPIHLIGHSTGGLDARLFTTPDAALPIIGPIEPEAFASRVASVVTVAAPNFGTPIATFFSSAFGAQLLKLISLGTVYTMEFGHVPLKIVLALGGLLSKADDYVGLENTILDEFYASLFRDFDEEKQEIISSFLSDVATDVSLVGQLTPGGIDLLNAAAGDREGVRYGCVVTKSRTPSWDSIKRIGFDPYRQSTHILYRFLHWLAADHRAKFPGPTADQKSALLDAYGRVPDGTDSDGVVPTRSQIWGDLFHAVEGDHLDVVGHFNDKHTDPPHRDWIATGTNFNRKNFDELWNSVSSYILQD